MKLRHVLLLLFVAAGAAWGGWFIGRKSAPVPATAAQESGRISSCSMHPHVRSSTPGKCPICHMALAPIYSGQGPGSDRLVMLGSNSITAIHVQSSEVTRRSLRRTLRVAGTIDDNDTTHRIVSAY